MKTAVERAFERGELKRPTEVLTNGCGAGWTGYFVPDEIANVEFGHECCAPHDLAYAIGGFLGIFTRKVRADIALGVCMTERFHRAAWCDLFHGRPCRGLCKFLIGAIAGPLYTLVVTLIGWTPFVWPWKKRDFSDEQLRALGELMKVSK